MDTTTTEAGAWAQQEFGHAVLGDARRTARLVAVAEGAAARPSGRITEVFATGAQRTATFRLMGHDEVRAIDVADAAHRACARRASEHPFVFVPVDGSSLNLSDHAGTKNLGVVGARSIGARGLQVMTAIAVSPEGTPLGVCGQTWWARKGRARRKGKRDGRQLRSKETQYWLDVMLQVGGVFADDAPSTRPWFQLDRGGDAWPVLLEGLQLDRLFTVRAAQDRRLWKREDEPRRLLWERIEAERSLGTYDLKVSGRPGRKERIAQLDVRACPVTLDLRDERTGKHRPATLWAVLAREENTVPAGEDAIEWLLLTTHPASSFDEAKLVVVGYAKRWKVEEFHRTWKSGACHVEDTQLRDRASILRWATVLASVAMRIMRLTYLARSKPETPATAELTQPEVDAVVALKRNTGFRRGQVPPIGRIVQWLAEIGGYTGKSSGGPPGAIVIARGLQRIQALAEYFTHEKPEEM